MYLQYKEEVVKKNTAVSGATAEHVPRRLSNKRENTKQYKNKQVPGYTPNNAGTVKGLRN